AEKYVEWLGKKISEAIYFAGGAEKIIFGTDYPVAKHSEALDLVRRLDVEESDKEKILCHKAERVIRLRRPKRISRSRTFLLGGDRNLTGYSRKASRDGTYGIRR